MKLKGEWAGDSTPAEPGLGSLACCSAGGGKFDAVAEGFQVVDQAALGRVRVVAAGEVVVAEFAVFAVVVQDMPDDHNEGVSDGDGGLATARLAESAVQTVELGADVAAGLARRPGALGEDVADLGVALAGAAGQASPGGLVVARTQPSPGRQVGRGREPRHVDPQLGDQDLGGPPPDPRDRAQQPQLLGERGQNLLDPLVQPVDHGREVVDVVQVQPGQQGVLVAEPPGA